ncbi:MAG: TrkH family potassium uptake protein [Lachnospiraceae bacterium]|jgi:trk system potassium uptake protein TrkH
MNNSIIRYVLGYVLRIEAALLLLPILVAMIYQEDTFSAFVVVAAGAFVLGSLMTWKKPRDTSVYIKEGCVATALCWIIMSIVGCLPFVMTGAIPSFTDALFETISGFTTTGSSVVNDLDVLPKSILFWRSFTHWIGGMGVLVFMLAVIPTIGGSSMNIMKAESPGPVVGKLVPKVRQTAATLYKIYIVMTVIQIIFLLLGRMPLLEAIMITFGTAGTGGFAVSNAGLASYSPYCQWVIAIFMMLFGVNFNAYYLIIMKKVRDAFKMEEIRGYFLMIASATALIFINIYDGTMTIEHTLRDVFFQVSSLSTSTGFVTVDYDQWPAFAKTVLIIVMFIGACAGSTGGGLKITRVELLFKSMFHEIYTYIHPKSVKKIKSDGKTVPEETIRSIQIYFFIFMVIFSVSLLLISLEGRDFESNFVAVLTAINNMGPGMSQFGPIENFSSMTVLSKYVMMFDMLAGRLELFPMIILFNPRVLKALFTPPKFNRNRKIWNY